MDAKRIQVKIYATSSPSLERFTPFFHRVIRDKLLDELVIDVADYAHVHSGPGVVLVGHASDYFADESDGRFGVAYTRKREAPPPAERLGDAFRRVLNIARLVEKEPGFEDVRFATNEILVRLNDRLNAKSDAAGYAALEGELTPIVTTLYGASNATIEKVGTPRDVLSARIRAKTAPASVGDLLARLG